MEKQFGAAVTKIDNIERRFIVMAEWRYIKHLANENVIKETESQLGVKFCNSFVAFIKKYNGGRPPISVFDTDKTEERTIKSFLSINPADTENMIKSNLFVSKIRDDIVPFGIDNFGNYICFSKSNENIVFLDFETGDIEKITDGFDEFLKIVSGG